MIDTASGPPAEPVPSAPPRRGGGLTVDRLASAGGPVQVVLFDARDVGSDGAAVREPHRHDYHELIWIEAGSGHHLLDGREVPVLPGTSTVIGRGQVHVFERAHAVRGAAVSLLLVWIERWYDAQRTERREVDDADIQLFRRFARVLERDFAAHHDAIHYADGVAVPPAALSQALNRVTGRSTKELVTDRVMLEAGRLLRFTDRAMGEIAYETGFSDPLYFSGAFKRYHGQPPTIYRDRARGVEPAA
jgi:AraC-like DNA-binding protein/quercetin dioxygenase-like cupin family protein